MSDTRKTNLKISAKDMAFIAVSAALVAVGAFIKIPLPMVSITLQWFFVMVSAIILGKKNSTISVLLYVLIGLCGIPVFTMGGGPQYILYPTFGYFIGFIVCAYLIGFAYEKGATKFWQVLLVNIAATAVLYLIGFAYYCLVVVLYIKDGRDLMGLVVPFLVTPIPGDLIKIILASLIAPRVRKALHYYFCIIF